MPSVQPWNTNQTPTKMQIIVKNNYHSSDPLCQHIFRVCLVFRHINPLHRPSEIIYRHEARKQARLASPKVLQSSCKDMLMKNHLIQRHVWVIREGGSEEDIAALVEALDLET